MRKIFTLVITLTTALLGMAAERTVEQAMQIAAMKTNGEKAPLRLPPVGGEVQVKLVEKVTKTNSTEAAYYVFNKTEGGFVVVSGDDVAPEVLLYSDEGSFEDASTNANFQYWMGRMQRQMTVIHATNAVAANTDAVDAISPLLRDANGTQIKWGQESPFNKKCPMDKYDNTRSYVGCVALAAAMVMMKWRYPEYGTGTKTYVWKNYYEKSQKDTLTFDYGNTPFLWDDMLAVYKGNSSSAAKDAVATLCYACGVACEMEYGGDEAGGSGAWTDEMGYGLITYLNYSLDRMVSTYSKSGYENTCKYAKTANIPCEWSVSFDQMATYFNQELEAGRPIIMGGEGDEDSGGHEFVCDGRDSNGYFHINWGWTGDCNCYCLLTALIPDRTEYNYSDEIDALLGVQPKTTAVETIVPTEPATKILRNGQLVIIKNNIEYDIYGR